MSSASPRGCSAEELGDSMESSQSAKPRLGIDVWPGSAHGLSDSSTCDFNTKLENSRLRGQVKQLQLDLKSEQDTIASLRRKLAESGKEKLDIISRCTAETASLMTANSSLRVDLEKREESLQQLQFEMNQLQRQLSQEVQAKSRREEQHATELEALEERLEEASRRHDVAQQQAAEQRVRLAADVELLSKELDDRDQAVTGCRLERASLEAERARLAGLVQQQAETISSLQDSARLLEGEVMRQKEASKRMHADLELLQGRELEANKELEAAKLKIKSLEECNEAERSAHLESRFSSEIVQLKFRDLEVALEAEKQAKLDALSKIERLHSHLRDVEEAYTDERKQCKQALEKLDKSEKDFANAQRKLQSELADKKSLVAGLTEQLEVHQLDVNALKAELQRARKKQVVMEDTYEGNTKDLEMLMADFNIAVDNRHTRDSKAGRIPAAMLDSLRQALVTYKKDLDFTAEELQKLRHLCDCLTEEADTYKEALGTSQAALQDAQHAASHAGSELAKVKVQLTEADAQLAAAKERLQEASQELSRERSAASGQHRELSAAVAQLKQEEDKYARLLQGLHQRLSFVVGHPNGSTGPAARHDTGAGGDAGASYGMRHSPASAAPLPSLDVSSLVLEQVVMATAELQRLRDKVKSFEEAEHGRERALADVRREHEDQLSRLRATFEAQEGKLRQQLEEAEQSCARLSDEMRQNSKASHKMAAEALGKVKQTGQLQQELENECTDLRAKVLLFNGHQRALHTAFAVLAGAYYALAARARALTVQRNLLDGHLRQMHLFKRRACQLWCTLSVADGDAGPVRAAISGGTSPDGVRLVTLAAATDNVANNVKPTWGSSLDAQPFPPLLRFRAAAVAVMAVHRLRRLQKFGCRAFAFTDPTGQQHNVRVGVAGSGFSSVVKDSGLGRRAGVKSLISESDVLEWLTSKDLLATVIACTEDVQEVMGKMTETEAFVRPGLLVTTLTNSFTKLVGRLEPLYCNSTNGERHESPESCKDTHGLAHVLGRGLRAALDRTQRATAGGLVRQRHSELLPFETIVTGLQQQTLALVRRLHASELDRRRARHDLASTRTQLADCERRAAESEGLRVAMRAELDRLTTQQETMVLTSTYEGVCRELREALGRERSAQQLLLQQGRQMEELTARVESMAAELDAARQALQEAEQTAACHQTIRQREEESVRQLTAQLARVDQERKSLRDDMYEAERALRTAVRNRDVVVNYLKTVQAALLQYSNDGGWCDLPQLLLSSDLLPSDGDSEQKTVELAACQAAVVSFASVLQNAGLRVAAQQADLVTYRAHIARLKEELTAACRRRELEPSSLVSEKGGLGSSGTAGGTAVATTATEKNHFENSLQPASYESRGGYRAKGHPLVSPLGKDEDEYGPLPLQEDSDVSFVTTAQEDATPGHRSPRLAHSHRTAGGSSRLLSVRGNCRTPATCQK